MLGVAREPDESDLAWGVLKGGERLASQGALFPRIESEAPAGTQATHRSGAASAKQSGAGPHGQAAADQGAQDPASKLEFRVARIVSVANHPDADGLYVLTLNTGSEAGGGTGDENQNSRTVCAGLKSSYTPEQLTGRTVVLFANLKPAKLRGVESRGMLLAADLPDGRAALLEPGEIPVGTVLQFADVAVTPKSKVSLKDFEKLALRVHQGRVRYGTRDMGSGENLVRSTAPDGAAVH
jgi:methionyl-tRNA synthetase